MALLKVSPALLPAENYKRLNAALDAIDALQQSTPQAVAGVQQSVTDLAKSLANEASIRGEGDTSLQKQINSTIEGTGSLQDQISDTNRYVGALNTSANDLYARLTALRASLMLINRPGYAVGAFAGTAIGRPGDLGDLPGGVIPTPLGPVYRVEGAGLIAPRAAIAWDPDAIWIVRGRYWRLKDVVDPNNNAMDFGIQWLDAADGDLGTTLLNRDRDLAVQSGPRLLTFRVPSVEGARQRITAPAGTVSWKPYLKTYGSDGATAVSILGAADASFAGVYAPDVYALAARLGTLEGQIGSGLALTAPILPSYSAADLRAGKPTPTAGRQAWASDGRARNADGTFEAANQGTGVEVQGNGKAWVYPGTNQQVQA